MLCPNCHSQTDNYCGQANKAAKYFCELCGAGQKLHDIVLNVQLKWHEK